MDWPEIKFAIDAAVEALLEDAEDQQDALSYVEEVTNELFSDLGLDTDDGDLYSKVTDAVTEAIKEA